MRRLYQEDTITSINTLVIKNLTIIGIFTGCKCESFDNSFLQV